MCEVDRWAVELVRRAKVIVMLAAGRSYSEIGEQLGCTDRYISPWKERFKQERLSGSVQLTASTKTDRDLREDWDGRKSGRQETAGAA